MALLNQFSTYPANIYTDPTTNVSVNIFSAKLINGKKIDAVYVWKCSWVTLCCCVWQSSWVISVELAIGPEEGISYLTDKGSNVSSVMLWLTCRGTNWLGNVNHSLSVQPTHLANFTHVQSIQFEERERKGMLQLDVAGAPEVTPVLFNLLFSFVLL